jgi:dihydroxy-acid dehydratase
LPKRNAQILFYRGPARCFDTELGAYHAIARGEIKKGDALVIRYQGPRVSYVIFIFFIIICFSLVQRTTSLLFTMHFFQLQGAPGMPEMLTPGAALVGSELGPFVPLITDGRFSGDEIFFCIFFFFFFF